MSTLVTKNIQVGADGTPANNFTIFQPVTPDGTLRIGNGNTGVTTGLVTLTSAGNFGIGTSSPSAKLDVTQSSAGNVVTTLMLRNPNSTVAGTGTKIYFSSVPGNNRGSYIESANTTGGNDTYLAFGTNSVGADATERARIDSSGNLLVGVASAIGGAAERFQVRTVLSGGSEYGIAVGGASGSYANYALRTINTATNTVVGSITFNASVTAYNTSSDYRLKENVQPMTGALAKVAQLKPVTYNWKADGSDGEGFIAHELAEVVPQCVTGEKDAVDAEGKPVYQGIDTSFLVATLTAALQETHALIKEQQTKIESLTARIAVLEGA